MPNHDPTSSLAWIAEELARLESTGLRRERGHSSGTQGATIEIGGRRLVNFGSNDYLGLAADPRLVGAAADAARQFGWGSGASPLVSGRSAVHVELERRLAKFEGTEAALLFTSGYAANTGTIAALVGADDAVFSDAKNHASLIDGCRLSRTEVFIYPHGDADALENQLRDARGFRRRLVVTDGLFSMDGDLAPLERLAELAEQYDAMLLVDEAHATGVFGERGRGACEALGVENRVSLRIGTISKALGGIGGFVAGPREAIEWLANRARSYVFSTAPPPAACAAAIAALDIVENEPRRRQKLLERAETLRRELADDGWKIGPSKSQIIPIVLGDPTAAMEAAAALRAKGFFVPGIRPPTVPEGESLLRISLCFGHNEAMIESLRDALRSLRRL